MRIWRWALLVLMLTGGAAQAAVLLPHRAGYRLTLASTRGGAEGVVAADGAMYFELARACDGWATRQQFRVQLAYATGDQVLLESTLSSWESLDGTRYRFHSRTWKDGALTQEIQGEAKLSHLGGKGVATLTKPEAERIDLPQGTLFPTTHTREMLDAAESGKVQVQRTLFDGSTLDGPDEVNAMIGPRLDATAGVPPDLAPYVGAPSWWIRMAFFPVDSTEAEPSYELGVRYHANGVADELKMDYGDFVLDGRLEKLEALTPPRC